MQNAPSIPTAPDYQEARTKAAEFVADLAAAHAEVARLRGPAQARGADGTSRWIGGEVEAARLADDQAQGQALIRGTKAPARVNETRVLRALEVAEQRVGALIVAVKQAEADVQQWLTDPERVEVLRAAVVEYEDDERQAYERAIDFLEAARLAFWATRALAGWLSDTSRRYKPVVPGLAVPGAAAANGEPLRLDGVLVALRDEVLPPEQTERPVNLRWRKETVYGDSADGQRSRVLEERFFPVAVYADGREQEVGA